MATPNDRRVIWGTHVVPQIAFTAGNSETREEGSIVGVSNYEDWKLDTTVAKIFGGKGSVDIKSDQGTDEWVSFLSPVDDIWEAVDNIWEDTSAVWDNAFYVGNIPGTTHPTNLRTDGGTVDFLYIKNLGSVALDASCFLTLDGTEYDIRIPPGAAVSMRVNSISASDIKVKTGSFFASATIEFVIARTP